MAKHQIILLVICCDLFLNLPDIIMRALPALSNLVVLALHFWAQNDKIKNMRRGIT
jgi:hypothetical protein